MKWLTRSAAAPRSVQAAIRVYATDWGFRGEGTRQIDWLLDGVTLRRDNVLFVIDKPIGAAYRQAFRDRQYQVYDASVPWPLDSFEIVNRWRWRRFLRYWRPHHWVSYNDDHPRQWIRNRLLREAGCQTWSYVHSVHDSEVFGPELGKKNPSRWLEAGYGHLIAWGKRDAALYCRTAEKHVVGPLWSAEVRPSPRLRSLLDVRFKKAGTGPVIAVFDTTFDPASLYGDEDALEFFGGLRAFLDRPEWSSAVLLYKPKNALAEIHERVPKAAVALEQLLNHPRCVALPPEIAPGAAIAEADLTISLAFTSTTVEALGARRRALYFDPKGRYRHSYYERFPNLVAHDRDELAWLCRYWLDMPDADFQKYLDYYITPEFGGRLDAGAIARFRAALSK